MGVNNFASNRELIQFKLIGFNYLLICTMCVRALTEYLHEAIWTSEIDFVIIVEGDIYDQDFIFDKLSRF